jgi:hypothetical protein
VDHAQGGVGFGAVILRHDRVRREREQTRDEGKGDKNQPDNPRKAT